MYQLQLDEFDWSFVYKMSTNEEFNITVDFSTARRHFKQEIINIRKRYIHSVIPAAMIASRQIVVYGLVSYPRQYYIIYDKIKRNRYRNYHSNSPQVYTQAIIETIL